MSYQSDCQKDGGSPEAVSYTTAVQKMAAPIVGRVVNPFLRNDLIFAWSKSGKEFYEHLAVSHKVSQSIIKNRKRELEALGEDVLSEKRSKKKLDFLDILLSVRDEDGQGLSDKEVQEQVDTFLFEGHDTTASALQWTLHYLATHPALQEQCRSEVRNVVGESEDIRHEHLNDLAYTTQFIKESMRISATVPSISRELAEDLEVDGHILPKGTWVGTPIYAIHHNPDVWHNPEVFDPDRFSPENSANRHPFAFIPFSAGPRNCIAQNLAFDELKTAVSSVLLRFRLKSGNTSDPEPLPTMISRPSEDIQILVDCVE